MSEWYKEKKLFPSYVDKNHPLYEALEFYHEDDGMVVPPGALVECDLATGYIKYQTGTQGEGHRKRDVFASTRGPWRCRWRPDKMIEVKDRPVPQHMYGYGAGGIV